MYRFILLLILISSGTSFSQTPVFEDYYEQYPNVKIPSQFYLKTDDHGKIIGSPDSVLAIVKFKVVKTEVEIRKGTPTILQSELMKCTNLISLTEYPEIKKEKYPINYSYFPKLRSLSLNSYWSTGQLDTICQTAKGLRHMYLPFNKPIPDSFFQLKELSFLHIDQGGKVQLSTDFSKMKSLKHVLFYNYQSGYDEAIWTIPNLEVLEIIQGKLLFPEKFQCSRSLQFLKLEEMDTLVFPLSFKGMDSLKALYIFNGRTSIHFNDSFRDLIGLKGLKINGCFINTTPDLTGMKELEELTIINCRIEKSYTLNFSNNGKLRYLKIENSNPANETVSKFPESLKGLTSLETLSLGYVIVNTIPSYFSNFHSLNSLSLGRCKIDYKSVLLLKAMTNLKYCSFEFADNITEEQRMVVQHPTRFRSVTDFGAPFMGKINWEPKRDNYTLYLTK
jgi:hypothetical protein